MYSCENGLELSAKYGVGEYLEQGGKNLDVKNENYPDQDDFFNNIEEKPATEILDDYERFYNTNLVESKLNMVKCVQMLMNTLNSQDIIEDASGLTNLLEIHARQVKMITTVRCTLINEKCIDPNDENDPVSQKINRIFEMLHHTTNAVRSMIKMREVASANYTPTINDDWGVSRFMPCNDSDHNPTQKLITSLLFKFWNLGYKRYKESCYEPIITKDGYKTNTYKQVGTVEDVMYSMCSDQYGEYALWKCITSNNAGKGALKHLLKATDSRFPELIKNRYAFSFTNGIYIVYNDEDFEKSDKFYKYKDTNFSKEVGNIVCCKYFDAEFPEDMYNTEDSDWAKIPTPNFHKIFDYQKIKLDVQNAIIQYFVGRMMYDVGELDDSQVSLFILGRAGTGKSTIINKMISEFYDCDDVGVLSSNIEGKFGLGAIYNSFIIIAPEVKRDCTLPQTEFQGMITGEALQLAVKNQPSVKVQWKAGLMSAGNQLYGYSDNSGSISRRLPVVEFDEMDTTGDANLGTNLRNEIPSMILKSNRAYLQYVREARRSGINDIWHYLPEYFKLQKQRVSAKTQGCLHFILNKLVYGPTKWNKRIKQDDFVQALNIHMRDYNFPKQPFDKDLFFAPFQQHKITIEEDRTNASKVMYVYGCEFAESATPDTGEPNPNEDENTNDESERTGAPPSGVKEQMQNDDSDTQDGLEESVLMSSIQCIT